MNPIKYAMSALLALVLFSTGGIALASQFNFSPGGLSQLIFVSDAPLETITGTSNVISGEVTGDLANPAGATGWISVDAASFRTGIDLRDEHLRGDMWIDATQYPELRFELSSASFPEGSVLAPAQTIAGTLTGNLTFHGVTREVTVPAELTYYELDEATREAGQMTGLVNNVLRIEAQFEFLLSDYGIGIPPMLSAKISDTISITLRLTGILQ